MTPNYYALLGVAPTAGASEIKRAYRRLARQYHPDLNAEARDEQIKGLNEAYEVLSSPEKRKAYDIARRQAREAARQERERLRRQQAEAEREPRISWVEGMFGFVRELKKEMRED